MSWLTAFVIDSIWAPAPWDSVSGVCIFAIIVHTDATSVHSARSWVTQGVEVGLRERSTRLSGRQIV